MGATDQGVGERGHICPDFGKDLHRDGTGNFSVWVGDVGDHTTHYEGFGCIPPLRKGIYGRRRYPSLEEVMKGVGLQEVETYVSRRHNASTLFIATRPIMDMCLAVERRPVSQVSKQWWDQEGMELERMRTAAWEVEREEMERI